MVQDNPPRPQEKDNNTKLMKDMGKWCQYHKSPTHNTIQLQDKQLMVVELKASESDVCSDLESELEKGNGKGKQIIDAKPSATVSTTKT